MNAFMTLFSKLVSMYFDFTFHYVNYVSNGYCHQNIKSVNVSTTSNAICIIYNTILSESRLHA